MYYNVPINSAESSMKTLSMKCEELVCIPAGMGSFQHVIFNPKGDTLEAIKAARDTGEYHTLQVEDNGGSHVTSKPQKIVNIKVCRKTIVVTGQEW